MSPEEMQKLILELQKENDSLKTTSETLTKAQAELTEKNKKLQESNLDFFLQLQAQRGKQGTTKEDKQDNTKDETIEDFARKIKL